MEKKSQAAMEFLMTYGWAILVALIAFAAVFYFGIIDLEGKLPEQTIFPAPIQNLENAVMHDGTIKIKLKNNLGHAIEIVPTGFNGSDDCVNITGFGSDTMNIDNGDIFVLSFNCTPVAGKTYIRTYLSFMYNNTFTGMQHVHTGYVTVNAK